LRSSEVQLVWLRGRAWDDQEGEPRLPSGVQQRTQSGRTV